MSDDVHRVVQSTSVDVADLYDVQILLTLALDQAVGVTGSHAAGSHHGHVQTIVCSHDPGVARRRQPGCDGGCRGGLQEASS